jgi:hypothetical protein
MRLSLFLLSLAVLLPTPAMALDQQQPQSLSDEESDLKKFREIMEEAAEYRVGRLSATPEQLSAEGADRYLAEARDLLARGHEIRARWRAGSGVDDHPYAPQFGDLLRTRLEGYAVGGNLSGVYDTLLKLWLFLPDWPGTEEAMRRAAEVAELEQDFVAAIDLDADDPSKVVAIDGSALLADSGTSALFRFLARHGDRATVAPRAALGLARAQLISGSRDAIFEARTAYEKFLDDYPASPEYTFTAICEYALSYLVTYRGSSYDMGALVMANTIIDQAEIETRGDPERVRTVQAYRKRIRAWMQDRDLTVARWYRDRGQPGYLRWLREPAGLISWSDGARMFYDSVIARDPASPQARDAERERAELPAKVAREVAP